MRYELLIGLRYTRAQPREGSGNHFISFIALISMLGLALGVAAFWLGRRLNSLHLWRALDGLVALMMWGTALWLLTSLA